MDEPYRDQVFTNHSTLSGVQSTEFFKLSHVLSYFSLYHLKLKASFSE